MATRKMAEAVMHQVRTILVEGAFVVAIKMAESVMHQVGAPHVSCVHYMCEQRFA